MSIFKVGDRVRLLNTVDCDPDGPAPGATGVIVDDDEIIPLVEWDGWHNRRYSSPILNTNRFPVWNHELELIP